MAVLNIRNLPDRTHARLRVRAAENGRSMEAEARAILIDACADDDAVASAADLPRWIDELYADSKPVGVVADLIAERRREAGRE